jgi:hypothetical protein
MSEEEWKLPAPREDPESREAWLVLDGRGRARLVPRGNIVEGEMEEDGGKAPPSCPFPSP